ncbi:MAG: hypothetical protein UW60_C0012G0040 [Candidatus Woesebacteria bacterium GW2011_GWA2_44_33]|uniref:Uncharacterized protein n=3 Tax=Microgenomates group TaxID=1794810 RepID=A0A0G1R9Z5_9BACT|nr:MAG: hypothetical protein UW60_C0012G0040 [Candidatus Woesebacteria bacterium GW2011_GWA2_44_33]KKT67827.1 MAG: hypothetical protein UW61_C0002G0005 [Candidatus Curtissbacteria bacterium GW2011_GWC1_44_33]KKU17710.1 MAG: hypothetical protein UX25_C0002G0004 [Candidatus Woesebacteria bacterium GW2011_GWC2_45_9]
MSKAEKIEESSFRELEKAKLLREVEVKASMKQIAIIVDVETGEGVLRCLYRPEKGVLLSLDPRIPKPQELYRDALYYRVSKLLGWNFVLPVAEWSLDGNDEGVLRPFLQQVETRQIYDFRVDKLRERSWFWLKVAALDYVCGVVDRRTNDFLFTPSSIFVVDSGLSFVEGEDFSYQSSIIREKLSGEILPEDIREALLRLSENQIQRLAVGVLDGKEVESVARRALKLADVGVIL